MSTIIRPQLATKNPYYLEKHRYYELKHFCLQYPLWQKSLLSMTELKGIDFHETIVPDTKTKCDPTAEVAEKRIFYTNRILMVEETAKETDDVLWSFILKAVSHELSYNYLKLKMNIPCCKDKYYDLYRKFFWLLSQKRQ